MHSSWESRRASIARGFLLSSYKICDDFLDSAKAPAKKSAITQSIRLQRQELRLCAISSLIVNTRFIRAV
jgi:hypothetical protein